MCIKCRIRCDNNPFLVVILFQIFEYVLPRIYNEFSQNKYKKCLIHVEFLFVSI